MGGRWLYKLTVSLKFAKATIQRYQNSMVDFGVTNLQCHWNLKSRPYKDTDIEGWTLALKKYSVLNFARSTKQRYNIQRWTLALQAYSVRDICLAYHTRIQKFNSGRWFSKLAVPGKILTVPVKNASDTMQRHKHSIVDVGVTNLPCPWNLQSLP